MTFNICAILRVTNPRDRNYPLGSFYLLYGTLPKPPYQVDIIIFNLQMKKLMLRAYLSMFIQLLSSLARLYTWEYMTS